MVFIIGHRLCIALYCRKWWRGRSFDAFAWASDRDAVLIGVLFVRVVVVAEDQCGIHERRILLRWLELPLWSSSPPAIFCCEVLVTKF